MKATKREIFITGSALLAMFLGAGNLIFPPMLGKQAGLNFGPAILGFVITGVGLPLLGVTAVAKAGGDLQHLANRVHPLFSKIITIIVVLSIGPLLAIPRTAATTFEVGVAPFLNNVNNNTALLATTVVYFALTLIFVLRPSKIVDNLGKFLTPFIIVFLALIICKGIISPHGSPSVSQYHSPFSQGFLEGYNTMDALASVIFGLVIVNSLKSKGFTNQNEIAKVTIFSGIIAAVGLSSIYVGLGYIGTTTGSLYNGSNPGEMLSYITEAILGPAGKAVIGITMTLACLTTSIGLVSSCGSFFNRLTNNRISYNFICTATVLVSAFLANMGLARILEISVPLLICVYPIIIVLIVLSLFQDMFHGNKAVYSAAVGGTAVISAANLVSSIASKLGFKLIFLDALLNSLPLREQGMEWIVPAVLLTLIAVFFSRHSKVSNLKTKLNIKNYS